MKKVMIGLCALLACFLMTSCSSYVDKAKNLAEKFQKAETAEEFEALLRDAAQMDLDFYKSNPSAEDIEAYEATSDIFEDLMKDEKKQEAFLEAFKKLTEDKDFMKLVEEGEKLKKEISEKNKDKDEKEE
jgi:PBP1b-binding outer membrane lipoprotein LpoB